MAKKDAQSACSGLSAVCCVTDGWFASNCKNSANVNKIEKEHKKETVPKHGLGFKIMEEIAKDHNGLFDVEYGTDYYKVSVILPL